MGEPPGPPYRLGQDHLPLLRRPCLPRDRHHAPVGWFFLVLPALYGPPLLRCPASKEALEYLVPGGLVQRRHGAYHPAPAVQPVLAKFLYDIGVVPTAEPYNKRTAHGMILGLNPHSFQNLPAEEQEAL